MLEKRIDILRHQSRKLIRELGMLQINQGKGKATPGHWHALIEVSKDLGITISKLGHLLLMSTSTISRIVKSLVKEGFLKVTEGKDKREKYLHLTDKGRAEIQKIDLFSELKIKGAFEYLADEEISEIIQSISKYSAALEKSRLIREQIKIKTLSTSRPLRKQIIQMIESIQRDEFAIPITEDTNIGVLKAEKEYYFNHSYNFWYATNDTGKIIGCIGLKKVNNQCEEIKKMFVVKEYRGKGVAQRLMTTLLEAAKSHKIETLFLGTVSKLEAAQKFYVKCGFKRIDQKELPAEFEICPLDTVFFKANVQEVLSKDKA